VTVAHTKTLETRVSEEVPGEGAASLQITADLLAVIPNLRAFAVSLCGNLDRADSALKQRLGGLLRWPLLALNKLVH